MKLTKQQSKLHKQAMDLVHSDKALTWEERLFILENYAEAQGQLNALAGAFFTPYGLACDASIEVGGGVLDPFFGSGTSGQVSQALGRAFIGCELNPAYADLQAERLRQPSLLLEVTS